MKIITVNIGKGGTGKSTVSFNLAKWLSDQKKKKTLLIDGDYSCNLSYSLQTGKESSSVIDIFLDQSFNPEAISSNLDFLKGSENLKDKFLDLQSKHNNCLIFFMWLMDHISVMEKYEYVIIDTHNNKDLVTLNFLAVADIILGVSDPSRNGLRAWLELEDTVEELKNDLVEARTRESYVNAEAYLIANRVDHIGNSSKVFLETAKIQPNYLGMIQKKEILAKSLMEDISVFEYYDKMNASEQQKQKAFIESLNELFEQIINLGGMNHE